MCCHPDYYQLRSRFSDELEVEARGTRALSGSIYVWSRTTLPSNGLTASRFSNVENREYEQEHPSWVDWRWHARDHQLLSHD